MKIKVSYDEFPENPMEWGEGHEFVQISQPRIGGGYILGLDADEAVGAYLSQYLLNDEEITEAVIKHYQRRGWIAKELKLRGYSQGDWLDGVYAYDPDNYGDMSEALDVYFKGEVYTVQLVDVCNCCGIDGEIIDSLGGCYLDDNYTPIDVAREHFDCDIPNDIEVEFVY